MNTNFKTKTIEVDPLHPYGNDLLNRQPYVENISKILQNTSTPITFSINAPWGQGKTTFLEMLGIDLRKNKSEVIKFSAWETDFADEPLLAFLGEMNISLEKILNGDKEKSKAWKNAKKVGSHIIKRGIPVAVKAATGGLLDIDKGLEGEAGKLAEKFSTDLIEQYSKDKNHIKTFKENISKVIASENGEPQRLYILIDELDRCRPTYAIELLERIKHLFDIEGLVFILAMDREQLSHSVKAIYGNEFESSGYLRRFIDIEFSLPQTSIEKFITSHLDYYELKSFYKDEVYSNSYINHEYTSLKDVILLLIKTCSLSLREIEQLLSKLNLAHISTKKGHYYYSSLLFYLLVIKDRHPSVYDKYIKDGTSPKGCIDLLHKIAPEELRQNPCAALEADLICSKYEDHDENNAALAIYNSRLSRNPPDI